MTTHSTPSSRPFHCPPGKTVLHCGNVSLESLASKYGTPLYVYSADQILERLALFQEAFASRAHLVCYAIKANSSLAILRILGQRGAGFDIVSGGELDRVLAAAPKAVDRVVFSGVGKTPTEIDHALRVGILQFNVESDQELDLLAERARRAEDQGPIRTPGQSRRLRRDASLHFDGLARTQIRYRHTTSARPLQASGIQSLARALWRKRAHRFADSFCGPFRRSNRARSSSRAPL